MTTGGWFLTVCGGAMTVFTVFVAVTVWRDRPRVVRGTDGKWRAARPYHNGWGDS